ncbi:hypothetical protein AKO1_007939 [Acrasis kona]|uniref:Uncharacterized protein n=1 Tax=Acrasis kona TaxID=1008807 RepID=A0AAW2YNF6_9EUKA
MSALGPNDVELQSTEQRPLQNASAPIVSNVTVTQVEQEPNLADEHPDEPEVSRFEATRDRIRNTIKSFGTTTKYFIHHKSKKDKRNYYCGNTCHGWATLFIYYLLFYAVLIGFFVGLYFLAYYIMPFPKQAALWQNPSAPYSLPQ